ncbi:gamma-glutamyltranspeptidase 1 [Podospora conica]|nr:gamma-glutamyltranspeptidase 1 [Schizothecium conicum]
MRTLGVTALLITLTSPFTTALPLQVPLNPNSHPKNGTRGAVACESALCSRIGTGMIELGGSAADALVAATLCVGVVAMYHSGIGGGGFLLVRDPKRGMWETVDYLDPERSMYETVDYRETAPAAAHRDMYAGLEETASTVGGLAVAVPGEVRGLAAVHERWGKLPWTTVVMPAVMVARVGFEVNEDLVKYMDRVGGNASFLVSDPAWAEDFAPNGTLVKLGDVMTRKRYADTLQTIAIDGPEAFYQGRIAESIVNTTQSSNGILTLADMASYSIKTLPALSIPYGPYTLFSTSSPSSGAIALAILNTLRNFPPVPFQTDPSPALTTHRLTESLKFAYASRALLGDPAYLSPPPSALESHLLSPSHGNTTHALINDTSVLPLSYYAPHLFAAPTNPGTSHLVAIDRSGLTLSSTTTVNLLFGAQLMTPDTGVVLNNEMDDFSQPGRRNAFGYEPAPENYIAPGKRPLSSISPVIAERGGAVVLATGAAGGSRIVSATAETVWRVLGRGMGLEEAVRGARVHDQLIPRETLVEEGVEEGVVRGLRERGHNVTVVPVGLSAVHGVVRGRDGVFEAVGETRLMGSGGSVV